MSKIRNITIQDIARHANVSRGTVDRVIHNREPQKVQLVPLDIIIRENLDFYLNFN